MGSEDGAELLASLVYDVSEEPTLAFERRDIECLQVHADNQAGSGWRSRARK
jgi:hypothetical protein